MDHIPSPGAGDTTPGRADGGSNTGGTTGDSAQVGPTERAQLRGTNPYPGLRPYGPDDAGLFAGRTAMRRALLTAAVPGGGIIVLIGGTGTGKTSLLAAGLRMDAARHGLRRDATTLSCQVRSMSPGADPMGHLATVFALPAPPATPENPSAWVEPALSRVPEGAATLLIVDDIVDLFVRVDAVTRNRFLKTIRRLASDPRCCVVIAVDDSLLTAAGAEADLAEAISSRTVRLLPMTVEETTEVIVQPARARGVGVQSTAVFAVLGGLSSLPPSLPPTMALSTALHELWRDNHTSEITAEDVARILPIAGAVDREAERAWATLTPEEQPAARALALRLTERGADGTMFAVTRHIDHLEGSPTADATRRLVGQLVAAGLLTVSADDEVSLRHPQLARLWNRLQQWVTDVQTTDGLFAALDADAQAWKRGGRRNSALYSQVRLDEVDRTVPDPRMLSGDTRDFLAQSRGHIIGRKRARISALIGGAVALVVVIALVLTTLIGGGGDSKSSGGQGNSDATVSEIAALARTDSTAAAQLALSAYQKRSDDPQLRQALLNTQNVALRTDLGATPAVALATARTTGRIALGDRDGSIRILENPALTTVATLPDSHGGSVTDITLNPSGTILASTGPDGTVTVWDLSDLAAVRQLSTIAATGPGVRTDAITFGTTQRLLAVAESTGTVRLYDLSDPSSPTQRSVLDAVTTPAQFVEFNPAASQLALGGSDRPLVLVDTSDPDNPARLQSSGKENTTPEALDYSPNAQFAVTSYESGAVQLWSVADPTNPQRIGEPIDPDGKGPATAVFSPSGTRLAVVSASGTISVYDITRPAARYRLTAPIATGITGLSTTVFQGEDALITTGEGPAVRWTLPSGLVTGGYGSATTPTCSPARTACATGFLGGPLHIIDTANPLAPTTVSQMTPTDPLNGAAMSPDGNWLVTVDARRQVQLWDARDLARPVEAGAALHVGPQQSNPLVFSPSSALLATGIDGTTSIRVWQVSASGLLPVGTLRGDSTQVAAVAFAPDSKSLAVAGNDGTVTLAGVTPTGLQQAPTGIRVGAPVTSMSFGAGRLVIGDAAGSIGEYEVASGTTPARSVRLGTPVTSVAVSGADVIAAGADGGLRRWTDKGRLEPVGAPAPTISDASAAAGGIRAAAAADAGVMVTGPDGWQRTWSTDPAAVAARICAAAPAPIRPDTTFECAPRPAK
ncbi:WD40 repeat domain-containing protein [Williamsia sp. CHRR-6]|uniref:WD40 repeat domain-containing protein n=1 Tax=Williamsia sp. CHRR-6 TaxID=2835871 RepID=UPI001BDAE3AE|nr:WD40 repeat domain-containing protein [Williamsia sp. CHRR-6]MBT0566567.1 WD40 repeat domain-containing protein [Williamsia sp. CHRR-6]